MRVYIVRHGEKEPRAGNPPLTPNGVEMSRAAGAWIAADGARVTQVRVSRMLRTHQTADALIPALALAAPPDRAVYPSGLSAGGALVQLLDGLTPDGDAVVVVHEGVQKRVEDTLGGRRFGVPDHHRAAVYRLERTARGWWATAAWEGWPKA